MGDKVTFPLCCTCVKTEIEKPLLEKSYVRSHNDKERQITGTWCTPELIEAENQGYKIKHIHEVWLFEEKPPGLFKEYINTWLKIKEKAVGQSMSGTTLSSNKSMSPSTWKKKKSRLTPPKAKKIVVTYPGQNDVEFYVGKVWAETQQNLSQGI